MATYEYEKVLANYATGRMDVEMTMGHSLQHIGQLYAAQSSATVDRQALRKSIQALETDLKTLQVSLEHWQKAQTDRLQTVENDLAALQQRLAKRQAKASLTVPKPETTHPKSQ